MNATVLVLVLSGAVFAGILALLARRLFARGFEGGVSADWLNEFSVAEYRPMGRLLNEADYEFLASQPGFDPEIVRNLRKSRKRILRAYLNRLSRDFNRLHFAARILVLHAPYDRPEASIQLLRQKLTFECLMVAVELRLLLNLDSAARPAVARLLETAEAMRESVRVLAPVPMSA